MMLEFDNWDDVDSETKLMDYVLPDMVSNIVVSHDGGRLSVSINGLQVFNECEGTRDCCVEINRREV